MIPSVLVAFNVAASSVEERERVGGVFEEERGFGGLCWLNDISELTGGWKESNVAEFGIRLPTMLGCFEGDDAK